MGWATRRAATPSRSCSLSANFEAELGTKCCHNTLNANPPLVELGTVAAKKLREATGRPRTREAFAGLGRYIIFSRLVACCLLQ